MRSVILQHAMRRFDVVVLATALLAAPVPAASGQTPASAWVSIETLRDTGEIDRALDASRRAVADHPTSATLLFQHVQVLAARHGAATAIAFVDDRIPATSDSTLSLTLAFARTPFLGQRARQGRLARRLSTRLPDHDLDGLVLGVQTTTAEVLRGVRSMSAAEVDALREAALAHPLAVEHPKLAAWLGTATAALQGFATAGRGDRARGRDEVWEAAQLGETLGVPTLAARWGLDAGTMAAWTPPDFGVPWLRAAHAGAERLGDRLLASIALNWLAVGLENHGDRTEARHVYDRCNAGFRELGYTFGLGWGLLSSGWLHWQQGEPDRALVEFQEARDAFRSVENDDGLGRALLNMGVVYSSTERSPEALRIYQEALDLNRTRNDPVQRARLLNNIANVHLNAGHGERALPLYEEALALVEGREPRETLNLLGNLALVSGGIGRGQEEQAFNQRALTLARDQDLKESEGQILLRMTRGQVMAGELAAAAENLETAEALLGDTGDFQARARLEQTRAFLARRQGDWGRSARAFAVRDSLYHNQGYEVARLGGIGGFAVATAYHGDLPAALALLAEGETIAASRGIVSYRLVFEEIRARLLAEFGDRDAAIAACRRALETAHQTRADVEMLRAAQTGVQWHNRVVSSYRSLETWIRLTGTETPEVAYEHLQRLKARSLLELVEPSRSLIRPEAPDSLVSVERRLKLRAVRLREELGSTPTDSLRLEVARAQSRHDYAFRRVLDSDPRYAEAVSATALELRRIRETFLRQPGTVIVDYFVPVPALERPSLVYAFVLDDAGLTLVALGDTELVEQQVAFALGVFQSPQGSKAASDAVSQALFDQLIGPFRDRLHGAREVIVIPDGPLHLVPFGALRVSEAEGYLGQVASLVQAPSLSVLASLIQRDPQSDRRLDLAVWRAPDAPGENTLAAAGAESRRLRASFGKAREFQPRVDAPDAREMLQEAGMLGSARILHFIAHGVFDDQRPWFGGLQLMSGEESYRHLLEAPDVYRLDFSADLVTLAACQSAKGNNLRGQGMQGFAQALFGSGASAVLATLWPVDDASTAEFMLDFYEGLADGRSKADALQAAQGLFQREPGLEHPYYWAGYVLIGDSRSGVELGRRSRGGRAEIGLLTLGLIALVAGLRMRSRRGAPGGLKTGHSTRA